MGNRQCRGWRCKGSGRVLLIAVKAEVGGLHGALLIIICVISRNTSKVYIFAVPLVSCVRAHVYVCGCSRVATVQCVASYVASKLEFICVVVCTRERR